MALNYNKWLMILIIFLVAVIIFGNTTKAFIQNVSTLSMDNMESLYDKVFPQEEHNNDWK